MSFAPELPLSLATKAAIIRAARIAGTIKPFADDFAIGSAMIVTGSACWIVGPNPPAIADIGVSATSAAQVIERWNVM